MLKPYLIVAGLVGFLLVFGFGYRMGGNSVKVEYQAKLNAQQVEAEKLVQENIEHVLATQAQNDLVKYNLEKERQNHVKETNRIRVLLATNSLRFIPVTSGQSSSDQVSNTTNTASNTNSTSVELPTKITANLRELAYDCDTLRDDYEILYKFSVK
jgi:hypothetical protein